MVLPPRGGGRVGRRQPFLRSPEIARFPGFFLKGRPPMPRSGHIALAGAPNVGKSSLLNALVGHHLAIVSPRAQATRLPVVGLVTQDDAQFIFHDLPGLLEPSYLMQTRMRE